MAVIVLLILYMNPPFFVAVHCLSLKTWVISAGICNNLFVYLVFKSNSRPIKRDSFNLSASREMLGLRHRAFLSEVSWSASRILGPSQFLFCHNLSGVLLWNALVKSPSAYSSSFPLSSSTFPVRYWILGRSRFQTLLILLPSFVLQVHQLNFIAWYPRVVCGCEFPVFGQLL